MAGGVGTVRCVQGATMFPPAPNLGRRTISEASHNHGACSQMQTSGKPPSIRRMENRIAELEDKLAGAGADIARLTRAATEHLAEIERLRFLSESHRVRASLHADKITEAAAFLDGMAQSLDIYD